jgi:hypothetical protein
VTSVENTEKCFKTLTGRTKTEKESEKQLLTPEDGKFRPKHVAVFKILKVTSVENTEKCFKTLTSRTKTERESESEIMRLVVNTYFHNNWSNS